MWLNQPALGWFDQEINLDRYPVTAEPVGVRFALVGIGCVRYGATCGVPGAKAGYDLDNADAVSRIQIWSEQMGTWCNAGRVL